MKKIMILGAGIYQVPLIRAAKEMGFFVIVVSIKGDYPGFALADKIYYINTTDREACLLYTSSFSPCEQIITQKIPLLQQRLERTRQRLECFSP